MRCRPGGREAGPWALVPGRVWGVGPVVLRAVCLWGRSSGAEAPSGVSQVRSCLGPEPTSRSTRVRQGARDGPAARTAPGARLPRVPAWGQLRVSSSPHLGCPVVVSSRAPAPRASTTGAGCPQLSSHTPFSMPPSWDSALPGRRRLHLPRGCRRRAGHREDTKGPQSHTLASGAGQGAGSHCLETSPLSRKIRTGRSRALPPAEARPQSYRPRGAALWGEGCLGKGSAKGGAASHIQMGDGGTWGVPRLAGVGAGASGPGRQAPGMAPTPLPAPLSSTTTAPDHLPSPNHRTGA